MQGSTAIQVVSALAPHVASLANYVRGQTWLAPPFSMDMVKDLLGREQTAAEDDREFAPHGGLKVLTWTPTMARQ